MRGGGKLFVGTVIKLLASLSLGGTDGGRDGCSASDLSLRLVSKEQWCSAGLLLALAFPPHTREPFVPVLGGEALGLLLPENICLQSKNSILWSLEIRNRNH